MALEWAARRIGDFATRKKIINEAGTDLPPLSVTKDRGVILQSEKYNKRVATDPKKYVIVGDGDFAFDPMGLYYGTIGRVAGIARGLISPDYVAFNVDSSVDPLFTEYLLRSPPVIQKYAVVAQAGNQHGKRRRVYWSVLQEVTVTVPPLSEQRKIAAILSSVDDTIEKTEAIIDQLEVVKRGLLQELLTRGMPGRHATYQQTPLGSMPSSWRCVRLRELLTESRYGTSIKCDSDSAASPVLRIPNVIGGRIDTGDLKYATLPVEEKARLALQPGDLLVVRTNGNPDYVGRAAVVGEGQRGWVYASYLIRLRLTPDADPVFVRLALESRNVRALLAKVTRTSAGNYNLNSEGLGGVFVPVPPTDEQREILAAVSSLGARLDAELASRSALQRAKCAILDALLSGRVHVNVTAEEAE